MSIKNYNKIMSHLNVIESELNKLTGIVGHQSFSEFMEVTPGL